MRRAALITALFAGFVMPAQAEAPERSLVPHARPVTGEAAVQTRVIPPKPRDPVGAFLNDLFSGQAGRKPTDTTVEQQSAGSASSGGTSVSRSMTPPARPENLQRKNTVQRTGLAALFQSQQERTTSAGSVCGVNTIKGTKLQAIPGKMAGCGVAQPVSITSVSGVKLSTQATVDCGTAQALDTWVRDSVKPTVGRLGGGVQGLYIMASYSCRTRNNRPGAKISEHGKGRAVDVGGIVLNNGEMLSVLDDWRSQHGAKMQAMHKGACGTFGTVLGPNADAAHRNHFHFDTARYRSGAYCR